MVKHTVKRHFKRGAEVYRETPCQQFDPLTSKGRNSALKNQNSVDDDAPLLQPNRATFISRLNNMHAFHKHVMINVHRKRGIEVQAYSFAVLRGAGKPRVDQSIGNCSYHEPLFCWWHGPVLGVTKKNWKLIPLIQFLTHSLEYWILLYCSPVQSTLKRIRNSLMSFLFCTYSTSSLSWSDIVQAHPCMLSLLLVVALWCVCGCGDERSLVPSTNLET